MIGGGGPNGGIGGGGAVILKRTTSGWTVVQRVGTSGLPIAIAPLSDASLRAGGADAIGDVMYYVGDWSGAGLVPEITILLNDGTGKVK